MLSFGWGELALIGVLVIVFVGPEDLPKVLRFLGRTYGKVRRASEDLRRAFTLEVDKVDAEARAEEIRKRREALIARRREEAERRKAEGGPVPLPMKEESAHTEKAKEALSKLETKPESQHVLKKETEDATRPAAEPSDPFATGQEFSAPEAPASPEEDAP